MPHQIYKYDKPSRATSEEAKGLLRYMMGIPADVSLDAFLIIGITTTPMSTTECISVSNWERTEEHLIVDLYQAGLFQCPIDGALCNCEEGARCEHS